jgi:hypothetical protein
MSTRPQHETALRLVRDEGREPPDGDLIGS